MNGRVLYACPRLVVNFQRIYSFHECMKHCALYVISREISVECHWERFLHRFYNCDRVIGRDARKLDAFEAYIWKIGTLHHSVHKFWFLMVFVALDDNLL